MQITKYSNLNLRITSKKYKFNFILALISFIIKEGKKKRAQTIVLLFFLKIKKFLYNDIFLKRYKKKTSFKNRIRFIVFFNYFFDMLIEKYRPRVFLKKKKIASKVYYLPTYINKNKSKFLFLKWYMQSVKERTEKTLVERLYEEFLDIIYKRGNTLKKLKEYYKIAKENRPFLKMLKKRRRKYRARLKKYSV